MLRLNFCVRDGNRWIPQAIVTGNQTGFGSFCCRAESSSSQQLLASHPQNRTGWIVGRMTNASFNPSTFSLPLPLSRPVPLPHKSSRFRVLVSPFGSTSVSPTPYSLFPTPFFFQDQALDRLVSPSSTRYRASTDDLSTLSSSRGLTCLLQWQFYSLGGLHA